MEYHSFWFAKKKLNFESLKFFNSKVTFFRSMLNSKPRTDIFSLKKVKFLNRTVRIALQNQNGPCSLLALFNLLILRNDIQVSNDHGSISLDTVVSILADFLLSKNSTSPSAQMQNHSENQNMQRLLEDCISILPSLKDGLGNFFEKILMELCFWSWFLNFI